MPDSEKYYLTEEGLEKIKRQYKQLTEIKQSKSQGGTPKILHSQEVNPEFLAFQEDMSLLEAQIAKLEKVLNNTEIIKAPPKNKRDRVQLGAKVKVDIGGERDQFRLVGTLEADPSEKKISNESPLGKALMGKKVGDEIRVKNAMINHSCKIIELKY